MSSKRFVLQYLKGLQGHFLFAAACVILGAGSGFLTPLIIRFSVDTVLGGKPSSLPWGIGSYLDSAGIPEYVRNHLWLMAFTVILVSFTAHSFTYLRGRLSAIVSEEFGRRLRNALFEHIQKLPYAWHSKVQTGDIIQRCTSDVETIRRFIGVQSLQLLRGIFLVMMVLPAMLMMDVQMALISTIVLPIIIVYAFIFFKQVQKRFTLSDEAEGYLTAVLEESLNGIRVVRSFDRQRFEIRRFDQAAEDYRHKSRKLISALAWYWASSDALCLGQMALVIVIGIAWVIDGRISLGTMLAFSTYIGWLLWPVREIGRILTDMGRALVSASRLQDIMQTPQEEMDAPHRIGASQRLRGDISLCGLSFGYDTRHPILQDINLHIKAGETIAIMGATGSGKSTLVNLIPRLFDAYQGELFIDGIELKNYHRQDLRRQIGIVLQEPFLYSRTLAQNIGIALPDASLAEIEGVCREAALWESIEDFAYGLNTIVGERGVTLSGGQRQRSAIARALIVEPSILILDDALSAVDSDTEQLIQANLARRKGRATTIIITHRLTGTALADRILVLERGKIAQLGTHEELISQPGVYQRIWHIQHQLEADTNSEEHYASL